MCCKASILEAAVIIYGTQSMFLRKRGVVPHHPSAVCFPLPFVQSTFFLLVDCSVFFTPLSVNTLRGRRLFSILHSAFSRHITRVSALRYLSLFVQPTYVFLKLMHTKKAAASSIVGEAAAFSIYAFFKSLLTLSHISETDSKGCSSMRGNSC